MNNQSTWSNPLQYAPCMFHLLNFCSAPFLFFFCILLSYEAHLFFRVEEHATV